MCLSSCSNEGHTCVLGDMKILQTRRIFSKGTAEMVAYWPMKHWKNTLFAASRRTMGFTNARTRESTGEAFHEPRILV